MNILKKIFRKIFANEKVSASAGSGKTFSLTTRFIALACADDKNGFDPFSIITLTFTKKAAGEFLSKILMRLANAASSEEEAEKLSTAIIKALPEANNLKLDQNTFGTVLALCAKNINKLHLSTIDSLFSTIIKQNANALKIFAPITLEDEDGFKTKQFMLETIARMMSNQTLTEKETSDFAELVKRASFGKEHKLLRDTIISTLKLAHNTYLQNNDLSRWGQAKLSGINFKHISWDEDVYSYLLSELEADLGETEEFDSIIKFFRNSGFAKIETQTSSLIDKILLCKRQGSLREITSLPYRKKEIPFPCAEIVDDMLDMLFSEHFVRLCEASKAVGKIASLYENEYETNVRQQGNITFSDMPFILSDAERQTEKEIIEYKLDTKFKHWLFDEFQDTSQIQWNVLRNLAEEAIISEEKSFYYVGDIKQSIYSWRGATPQLFNEISNYYNTNVELLSKAKPLTVSWRSGKHVIDAVNRIFGDQQELARVFPPEAVDTFSSEFMPHKSAESIGLRPSQPSFAQLRLYKGSMNSDEDTSEVCNQILQILKECEPLKRGISCAVLVSKNKQANAIVDFLKENGFNAAGELSVPIHKDRPIVSIFTAILKKLAHPKNTASDAYCKMAGLGEFTDNFSNSFIAKSLTKIYTDGFGAFAKEYEKFLTEKLKNTNVVEFKWLSDCCLKLDKNGTTSLDEAIEFISQRKIATSSGDGVIQVMTIHKSKGLAFGMVIMPVKLDNRPRNSIVKMGESMMLSPNTILAEMNADLFEHSKTQRTSEAFETICKLYVATTRPERALYIIAPKFAESSLKIKPEESINFTQLMLSAFKSELKSCVKLKEAKAIYKEIVETNLPLEIGNRNWFEKISATSEVKPRAKIATIKSVTAQNPIKKHEPSKTSSEVTVEDEELAQEGTNIHSFFEKLKTINDSTFELIKSENIFEDEQVQLSVLSLLENPNFRKFFDNKNAFEANEYPIFAKCNSYVISGKIDRLILFKDNENFTSAIIVDYKPSTNFIEKYKPQLDSYKYAVSKTFDIIPKNISCFIVGYRDGQVKQI